MKKIFNRYIRILRIEIWNLSYKIRNPKLTAFLWVFLSKPLFPVTKYQKKIVIVFNNGGGDLDLLSKPTDFQLQHRFYIIDKLSTDHLFKSFFGTVCADYEYSKFIKKHNETYIKYEQYIASLVTSLISNYKLSGFINFNFVYSSHQSIINLAYKNAIPFITVYKECLRPKGYWFDTIEGFRTCIQRTNVSSILAHNEDTKYALIKSGIISDDKIHVVGQARSDCLFNNIYKEYSRGDSKTIIFYAVSPKAGLPTFDMGELTHRTTDIINRVSNVNRSNSNQIIMTSLIEYIQSRNNIKLVVKGKTKLWVEQEGKNKNVSFYSGPPDFSLLENAQVVVGFNTTALLEAVVANIPSISIDLSGSDKDLLLEHQYVYDFRGVIHQIDDIKALHDVLDTILLRNTPPQLNKNRQYILQKYLGNSDGNSGTRQWEEISKSLT